jgi:hypothetical protein
MKRIRPKKPPLKPDGLPMSDNDFRALHEQLAEFDKVEWIDEGTRQIVEQYMPDLVDRLPDRTTETLELVIGRTRAAAVRKTTRRRKAPAKPQR